MNAPERIFVEIIGDDVKVWYGGSVGRLPGYVRADLYEAMRAERDAMQRQWAYFQELAGQHRKELEAEISELRAERDALAERCRRLEEAPLDGFVSTRFSPPFPVPRGAVMGTVIHTATIVTTFASPTSDTVQRGLAMAVAIFGAGMVTLPARSPINSYTSFVILTCGSKSGWPEKDEDDRKRAQFHEWVARQAYEDGSNSLEVVTVEYGNDLGTARVQP